MAANISQRAPKLIYFCQFFGSKSSPELPLQCFWPHLWPHAFHPIIYYVLTTLGILRNIVCSSHLALLRWLLANGNKVVPWHPETCRKPVLLPPKCTLSPNLRATKTYSFALWLHFCMICGTPWSSNVLNVAYSTPQSSQLTPKLPPRAFN